jgi:hypothetical protein
LACQAKGRGFKSRRSRTRSETARLDESVGLFVYNE